MIQTYEIAALTVKIRAFAVRASGLYGEYYLGRGKITAAIYNLREARRRHTAHGRRVCVERAREAFRAALALMAMEGQPS